MDTENKKDNTPNYAIFLVIALLLGFIIMLVKLFTTI